MFIINIVTTFFNIVLHKYYCVKEVRLKKTSYYYLKKFFEKKFIFGFCSMKKSTSFTFNKKLQLFTATRQSSYIHKQNEIEIIMRFM